MTRAAILAGFLAMAAGGAMAATPGNCTLHNLDACTSSNEFFWGPTQKSGRAIARHEFPEAMAAFLRDAPKLYLGQMGFTPAQIAANALVGPGDHHDPLPGGGWFFDGFTPHDAQERGAVLFDAGGKIQLVALLNVESDAAGPAIPDMNHYHLRLYSHGDADTAKIRLLQNWAGYTVKTDNRKAPQAQEILAGTQLLILENGQWRQRP
jgi:hypothetical protein